MSPRKATSVLLPTKISEAAFQGRIIDVAKLAQWRVNHQRPAMLANGKWVTAVSGHKGYPDLTLARRGRILIREIKLDDTDLEPDQVKWADEFFPGGWKPTIGWLDAERAILPYDIWRPRDWPLILRILTSRRP